MMETYFHATRTIDTVNRRLERKPDSHLTTAPSPRVVVYTAFIEHQLNDLLYFTHCTTLQMLCKMAANVCEFAVIQEKDGFDASEHYKISKVKPYLALGDQAATNVFTKNTSGEYENRSATERAALRRLYEIRLAEYATTKENDQVASIRKNMVLDSRDAKLHYMLACRYPVPRTCRHWLWASRKNERRTVEIWRGYHGASVAAIREFTAYTTAKDAAARRGNKISAR
jgi:hypothetical protein